MPVLEDDEFLIYESRAICQYIARKYAGQGTELMAAKDDLEGQAKYDQVWTLLKCKQRANINKHDRLALSR